MKEVGLGFLLVLVFPMLLAGVGHMIVVKKNYFQFLKTPIHQSSFGANKTWRGMIVMPVFTILAMLILFQLDQQKIINAGILTSLNPVFSGFLLGLAYVVFELPNSFIKRRLKVEPGKLPENNKFFFFLMDHTDSAIGCLLVYRLLFGFSVKILALVLIFGILIHTLVNLLLYVLKIRKNPF